MPSSGNYKMVVKNQFSRKFAPKMHPADPFTSGYFYIRFENNAVMKSISQAIPMFWGADSAISEDNIVKILSATCTGVTSMPGGTMSTIIHTGQGGVKYGVAGNVEYTNEVTLKFTEFTQTPLLKIIGAWSNLMREHATGASMLSPGATGIEYTKANYSGVLYYWIVAPDGITPEFFCCMEGVFPMRDPIDMFTSDNTTSEKLELDINFHVDYVWIRPWVLTQVKSFMTQIQADRDSILNYSGMPGNPTGPATNG